ncbi:MAG: ABC transporter permease [Lachnospiraceae bacterium]|nr:ABC transporter permease [Lachnospiraceae bacterium]
MSTALLISIISTAVVYAATVLYAAVGEIFSQRAGVMNLGLEGIMLMGAVSGYMVAVYQQNLFLAMCVVILVGAALGLVFSFLTVTMQADQTVCGMAMLTFGTGLSGFLGKSVAGVNADLAFEPIPIPVLSRIPVLGPSLFSQNILVYLIYLIIPLSMIYIYKTRAGMILRALGENPAALDSAGYNVYALRYAYVIFGSIMTAVGGAVVSLAYTNFWSDGMTSGKGWIAVALVVFSAWNPLTATFGAMLFGAISIIGIDVQTLFPSVPSQVFAALPYIATIIVLIFTTGNFGGRRSSAPAALTIPYDREKR